MVSVGSMKAYVCSMFPQLLAVFDGGFWMANERFLMFLFFG